MSQVKAGAMEESRRCHVVVLPWLAFGHLIPFLEFSKSLAARGIKVSSISTPRNIQRLPVIPPDLASHIDLVKFPRPSEDGLPENAEATTDVELGEVQYLKKAHDRLEETFGGFVGATSPDWIIYDCPSFWAARVAERFGVPSAFFSSYGAKALRLVMVEAEGESFAANAKKMMPIFANKSLHGSYMDEVVQYLVGYQRPRCNS